MHRWMRGWGLPKASWEGQRIGDDRLTDGLKGYAQRGNRMKVLRRPSLGLVQSRKVHASRWCRCKRSSTIINWKSAGSKLEGDRDH